MERIDFDRDAVFGVRDENLALAGVAHVASGEQGLEVGLSVLPGHRRRGLGRALFRRAVAYARGRRMPQLFMHFRTGSAPIVRIAQRFGMNIVSRGVEARAQLVLR